MCTLESLLAGRGPISAMVTREIDTIRATYCKLRAAWHARDLANVAVAVSQLEERVGRHMRWEERHLLTHFETRSDSTELHSVERHRLHHESLGRDLDRIELLVARREGNAAGTDDELELAVAELEARLDAHAFEELALVCLKLDALDSELVATIRAALHDETQSTLLSGLSCPAPARQASVSCTSAERTPSRR